MMMMMKEVIGACQYVLLADVRTTFVAFDKSL
jgi:hypothetical protein